MTSIRVVYTERPTTPATDQHPDAVRYKVGNVWVDAIGGIPTQAEIDAVTNPVPVDQSNIDNMQDKNLKALALVVAAWGGKTPAQLKSAFKQAFDSLP